MPQTIFSKALSGPKINFQLFGNWEEAIRVLNKLDPAIKAASLAAQEDVLKKIEKAVKRHLRNQDLPWKPLNADYRRRKSSGGLSSDILIAWRKYYDNIEVWKQGSRHFAFMGIRKGIYTKSVDGKKSRLDVATIAFINEVGGGKVPARPLWGPTIREFGGARGIRDAFVVSLHKKLRARGIPVKLFSQYRIFKSKSWG